MGVREDNAARVRSAIVGAARGEFEERGYEGASMRRVAKAAGVATGTLFNYAEDKVDLLRQVLHTDLEDALETACAVPSDGPLVGQLVGVAEVPLTRFAAQPRLYRALLKESLFATGARGEAFKEQVERLAGHVAARVEAGGSHVPPQVAALHFVSAYYLALVTCLASEPPDVQGALRRMAVQLGSVLEGQQ